MNYEEQYTVYQMAVETVLQIAVPTDIPSPLRDAMQYSLLAGGKRLRPVLLLAAYNMFIDDYSAALPFAVAVEMVHTYSLIHDDLPAMDNDDFRRGHPTCHKVYGEGMAVLAGDGLLSLAFEMMSQSEHPYAFQALAELAHRCGTRGMVAGQCADLSAEKEGGDSALLHYIHLHKTADLLTAPLMMGGMLAGADERVLDELREYGKNLGIAFQIIDDILDVVGDEKMLGKQIGKDAQEHKCTWVSLYGLDQAKYDAEKYTSLAVSSIKGRENAALFLKTLAQKALVRVQ